MQLISLLDIPRGFTLVNGDKSEKCRVKDNQPNYLKGENHMKKFTRTISYTKAVMTNLETGVEFEIHVEGVKTKEEVLKTYFKTNAYEPLKVEIEVIEEKREMSVVDFIANSTVVKEA